MWPDPIAYYNLSVAPTEEGRVAEAKENYLEALRLKPNFPEARQNLKRVPPLLELRDFRGDGLFGGTEALKRSLGRIIDPF